MILQQRKAQHAALVSYEQETGGSDPLLPEFWEEDLSAMEREEMALLQEIEMVEAAEAERAAEVLVSQGVSGQAIGEQEDEKMRTYEQCGEYEEWQYGYDDWENGLEEFDEAELAELEAAARAAKGDSMDVD